MVLLVALTALRALFKQPPVRPAVILALPGHTRAFLLDQFVSAARLDITLLLNKRLVLPAPKAKYKYGHTLIHVSLAQLEHIHPLPAALLASLRG